jgi:hypothetical protein
MGKKSGGGGSTTYAQSPEAQQMMQLMMPAVGRIGEAGGSGGTLWDVPNAPGVTPAPMPNQGWFGGLDSNIMSGLWEPYKQGSQMLMEQLGPQSARAGISGSGAAGLGKFWEQAGRNVGQQAWNMINPNAMAQWQMGNQNAMQQWAQNLYARQAPYSMIPGMAGGAMPTPMMTPGGGKK